MYTAIYNFVNKNTKFETVKLYAYPVFRIGRVLKLKSYIPCNMFNLKKDGNSGQGQSSVRMHAC